MPWEDPRTEETPLHPCTVANWTKSPRHDRYPPIVASVSLRSLYNLRCERTIWFRMANRATADRNVDWARPKSGARPQRWHMGNADSQREYAWFQAPSWQPTV